MDEKNTNTANEGQAPEKKFSQEELDAIIGDRLAREKAKYSGFEEYKNKAQKYDEAQEAAKSELEKMTEKANALQSKLDGMIKADDVRKVKEAISKEFDIPADLLFGETEEDCRKYAEKFNEYRQTLKPGYTPVKNPGELQKPTGKLTPAQEFAKWMQDQE